MTPLFDDTYGDEIICPYCKHEFTDSYDYDSDESVIECVNCSKHFVYERSRSVTYTCMPRCTLNEQQHVFVEGSAGYKICSVCGKLSMEKE